MPDSFRQAILALPAAVSVQPQEDDSSKVWILLLGVSLAHACLLWQGYKVPGFFHALDWVFSSGMLLFMAGLMLAKAQGWARIRWLIAALTVGNVLFLVFRLAYSLFGIGTSERIITELSTTTFWALTVPVLVASLRAPEIARWFSWLLPLTVVLLMVGFSLTSAGQRATVGIWFSVMQFGLASFLVLLASQFVAELRARWVRSQADNQALSRLAFFDELTGLNNRTFLDQRLQELCDAQEPLAVLFADLDGFKSINDTLGHATGDAVLRVLAGRLKEMGHATACLSRVSGDEFVVVLTGRTREEIATFAEWMVRELSRPITLENQEMRLSVSVGISLYPDDAQTAHDLLLQADRAMYSVKRTGKNGYRFDGDLVMGVDEPRQLIEQELRLARERGELSLLFQPICDIRDGEPRSVEVLLRWHSTTLGRIGPDVFIPIAEESGLIGSLGEWVLSSALAAAQVWQAEGFQNLRVAVNVSPLQLMQTGFVEMVEEALERYDLPPRVLELEVTEGVDLHERSQVMHCLQQLRELGVVLSLDDFGTGFASLSRLNELPVQVVKIDRLFVADLSNDTLEERTRYVRTLISAMVGVASSLELELVVEGVETDEQREQLLALGCSRAQGYYFARPMPEAELRGKLWLQDWAVGAD